MRPPDGKTIILLRHTECTARRWMASYVVYPPPLCRTSLFGITPNFILQYGFINPFDADDSESSRIGTDPGSLQSCNVCRPTKNFANKILIYNNINDIRKTSYTPQSIRCGRNVSINLHYQILNISRCAKDTQLEKTKCHVFEKVR